MLDRPQRPAFAELLQGLLRARHGLRPRAEPRGARKNQRQRVWGQLEHGGRVLQDVDEVQLELGVAGREEGAALHAACRLYFTGSHAVQARPA